jgi:NADH-quinone oxidoreductase subunit G
VLGKRLPYDDREALRVAIVADAPHFALLDKVPDHGAADPAIWNAVGADGPVDPALPLGSAITDYYLTNPIARASRTMAECSRVFAHGAQAMAAE